MANGTYENCTPPQPKTVTHSPQPETAWLWPVSTTVTLPAEWPNDACMWGGEIITGAPDTWEFYHGSDKQPCS